MFLNKFLLVRFPGNISIAGGDDNTNMTAALRDLYSTMDKGTTVPPIMVMQVLHMAMPRFAERGENGGYQQQDANECWMEVLRMLQVSFKSFIHHIIFNLIFRPKLMHLRVPPSLMPLISSLVSSATVRPSVMRLPRKHQPSQWRNFFSFHVTLTRMSSIFTPDSRTD